jgi:hypothetical protein
MIADAMIKIISLLSAVYTLEWGSKSGSKDSRTDWDIPSDTRELISNLKQHRLLFNQLHLDTFASIDDESRLRMQDALIHLEAMYPINKDMYPTIWDLYSSFQGRGIVMTTGDFHFK